MAFGCLQTVTHAQQATNAEPFGVWKPQTLASGVYGPDPKYVWYAGEVIKIDGTNFHYQ